MITDGFRRAQAGQASIELIAAAIVLVLVVAALWQGLRIAQSRWLVGAAARAAARAQAVGADPLEAARRALPQRLRAGARVRVSRHDGAVRVLVPLPAVAGLRLGTLAARSRMEPQR